MLYHILHRINLRKSGILNDVSTTLNGIIARSTMAKRTMARSIMARSIMVKQNDVNVLLVTDPDNKN